MGTRSLFFSLLLLPLAGLSQLQINPISGKVLSGNGFISTPLGPPGLYVDSVGGSDSNTGSSNSPFATLAKVTTVLSGSTAATNIYLARGSVFRESWQIPSNSIVNCYGSNNYAPYGVYGGVTNSKPVISGAAYLTNAQFTATPLCTDTWQYAISVPFETNQYAVISHTNVLMVWENNVRMGFLWSANLGFGSTNKVDANAGSFWYDTNAHLLYIHPVDNSNPTSNGKTYEASIRTLALHGGDAFTVKNLIAEKAYAFNTVGQQGYALLGYESGLYQRCVGRYGWNHLIGVANSQPTSAPLIFDSCFGFDMEIMHSYNGAGIAFVADKQASAGPNSVYFTNCLAGTTIFDPLEQNTGLATHTTTNCSVYIDKCAATNFYNGFQVDSISTSSLNSNISAQCQNGVLVNNAVTISNFSAYNCAAMAKFNYTGDAKMFNCKSAQSQSGASTIAAVTSNNSNLYSTNNSFGSTNNFGEHFSWAVNNKYYHSWSNSFFKLEFVYEAGAMGSGDWNNYFSNTRIASDQTNSPGLFTALSAWKTAQAGNGFEQNSTSTDTSGTFNAAFFQFTATDPTGGDAN